MPDPSAGLVEFYRGMSAGSCCAVIGLPGTGKSRGAQAADRAGVFRRRVVYDPCARIDRRKRKTDGGPKRTPWPGRLVTPEELAANPSQLLWDPVQLVVCPEGDLDPHEHGPHFARTARLVYNAGGIDLLAEECGQYSRQAAELILKLSSTGAHVGMRLVLFCQSLGRITIDGRRHLSHLVAFAQGEEGDLKAIRARCGRDFAEAVARLPVGSPALTWKVGAHLGAVA